MSLPSQRQPPGPDSIIGIIIPRGAKHDVLSRLIIRKDPLCPSVKLLGESVQVLGVVELGTSELL